MKALWKYHGASSSDSRGWVPPAPWVFVLALFLVLMLMPLTMSCSIAEDLTTTTTSMAVATATSASTEPPTTGSTETGAVVTETTMVTETTATPETTEAPETTLAPETTEATETTLAPETTLPPDTTTAVTEVASTTTDTESVTTTLPDETTTTLLGDEPGPPIPGPDIAPPPPVIEDDEPEPKVLYEINRWSAEGTSGWAAAGQWKTVDGMLVTDGSSDSFAVAPVDLTDYPDYVIECEVQIIDPEETDVFLMARMINGVGYRCGFDGSASRMRICFDTDKIRSVPFVLDDRWHTYRLEVRGNNLKLFFEQAEVARAMSNRALEPGTVGIYCENGQINVRSFRVIAL